MSLLRINNSLAGLMEVTSFFPESRPGFQITAHMIYSRDWFEVGKSHTRGLRFACRPKAVEYFYLATSYLLFKQIDVIKDRSVFSTLGWSAEPPQDLGELVGWLVAGGPLSKVPEAAGAGGSSHA